MLRSLFKRVLLKRNGVALGLWGEPGIGKSHTAKHFLEALPCQSLSLHATAPLVTLVQHLPKAKKLASWAERTLSRLKTGEAVEAPKVLEAIAAALASLAPFVMHFEDIHEVDEERHEFIRVLAQMIQRSRGVGLLVTSRTEPPDPFERIRLEPLTRQEAERLLERAAASHLPEEATGWITSRAAGNPLYTLEFFRFLSRQGYLWSDGKRWHWRRPKLVLMPPTVEALIELSLAEVRRDERLEATLQAGALLPRDTSDTLWQGVAELSEPELVAAKLELERRGVFSKGNFVHPLYREIALKQVPQAKRSALARQALALLHDDPIRAAGFIGAASLDRTTALTLLSRAAKAAQEGGNAVLAGRLMAEASEHAVGEEKGRLALEAAKVLDGIDYGLMLELAAKASAHLSDPTEALYLQATALAVRGDHEGMQGLLRRLPPAAKQGVVWLQRYIKLLHQSARHEEVIQVWEADPNREQCDGKTIYHVGWAYMHQGNLHAAADLVALWLAKPQATEDDRGSLGELQAAIAFYGGRFEDADTIYSEVLSRFRQDTSVPLESVANVLRNRSLTRLQQGHYWESLPDLQETLDIYASVGNSIHYAQTLVMMSYVLVELGEYERTEDILLEALEIFRRTEPQPWLVNTLVQLSILYLEWSAQIHPILALKYAQDALHVAQALHQEIAIIIALPALSCAKTAVGQAAEGLALADGALERAGQMGFAEAVVEITFAKGSALKALGRVREARDALVTAHQLAEKYGLALQANRYGLELAYLDGDVESARRRLEWFEKRGLLQSVAIAKRYFPELGTQTKQAGPAPSDVPDLDVLGAMRLRQGGQEIPVRGRKRQEILVLLLEARMAGRPEVSRLELVDALYPGGDEARALNSLKQLVSNLRADLGESAVKTTSAGYALGQLRSDAERFLETGDTSLWRGCYHVGLSLRESVRESLYLALAARAKALLASDTKEAARVTSILLEANPYSPAYLQLRLLALREVKQYRTLRSVYNEAKRRFAEVGETFPEAWIAFLSSQSHSLP